MNVSPGSQSCVGRNSGAKPFVRIGLTGSIAAGKSAVSAMLAQAGAIIIDADIISREIVEPGQKGAAAIRTYFGDAMFDEYGRLMRKRLSEVIFDDPAKRKQLDEILHPLIKQVIFQKLADFEKQPAPPGNPVHSWVVIDAALLIESGLYREMDEVWLVVCRDEIRLARLMERDGIGEDQALARINSQMPQSEKARYADHIIDNSASFDETRRQVLALMQ